MANYEKLKYNNKTSCIQMRQFIDGAVKKLSAELNKQTNSAQEPQQKQIN